MLWTVKWQRITAGKDQLATPQRAGLAAFGEGQEATQVR